MISAIGGVSIWSSDLNNLLPFYRDVVGLPVQMDGSEGGFALLGEAGQPALGIGTHSEVRGSSTDPFRIMVGFMTTDIQADVDRMKDAGAHFMEEPNLQPGGGLWLATFKDPEGNIGQLFQFVES